jgi:hypothetical protein
MSQRQYVTGRDSAAEQLLYVLNGQQTVPLQDIDFILITGIYIPGPDEPQDWPFTPGEIIPVVDTGRDADHSFDEFLGKGRSDKPWPEMRTVIEQGHDLETLIELADKVKRGETGYYEQGPHGWQPFANQREGRSRWAGAADSYVRLGPATHNSW